MCERGFKRLQECWECYSDKLTEPGVYQPLLSIMVKLRRGAKPQFKVEHTYMSPLFSGLPCMHFFFGHYMTRSTLVCLGSGGWIWKASDCSSHTRAGECRESGDGWGQPETRRRTREGSRAHSPGQQRRRQDKEGSESHSNDYMSAILGNETIMAFHLAGRAKPSVSTHDDSFVTPQRSRKPKKTVITFSSDEEEDEEGECRSHCSL